MMIEVRPGKGNQILSPQIEPSFGSGKPEAGQRYILSGQLDLPTSISRRGFKGVSLWPQDEGYAVRDNQRRN
jgi:hypothetical protein